MLTIGMKSGTTQTGNKGWFEVANVGEWIKKWAWAIVLAIISVLALGRKPKWVTTKEREIKDRDKQINVATKRSDDVATTYEEVKAGHDNAIKEAGQGEGKPGFTDPDSAASFIDDILGKRK